MNRQAASERILDLFLRTCARKAEEFGLDAVSVSAAMEVTDEGEHIANGFVLHNNTLANPAAALAVCQNVTTQNVTQSITALAQKTVQEPAEAAEVEAAPTAQA